MVHGTSFTFPDIVAFHDSQTAVSAGDVLTQALRAGPQKILAAAIEKEVANYISKRSEIVDEDGRRLVVGDQSRLLCHAL